MSRIPATTPSTPSSLDNFSTNCRGLRCLTLAKSIKNSFGGTLPQNGAQEERTRWRSYFATIGALFVEYYSLSVRIVTKKKIHAPNTKKLKTIKVTSSTETKATNLVVKKSKKLMCLQVTTIKKQILILIITLYGE